MTWYLDGKNLSNYAWNITNRAAGWAVPAKTGDNVTVPGRHGAFWVPNKTYDQGHLTLSMWADGCNEDGSFPEGVSSQKKVRDNLDRLTSLFGATNRLLTLRHVTGDDQLLVNEISNPLALSRTYSGTNLATNYLHDPAGSGQVAVEISRNLAANPYANPADSAVEDIVTEDLYPDPGLFKHARDSFKDLLTSYYFPIKQDSPTYNQFWAGFNGFTYQTGVAGHGVIKLSGSRQWAESKWVGSINRRVSADRTRKVTFAMNFKLADSVAVATQTMQITPFVSNDNSTWTAGTPVTFTATKDYQWVFVPPTKLAAMSAGSRFYVSYRIELVGAFNPVDGVNFELTRVMIQDAPEVGNPWIGSEISDHFFIGDETPGAWAKGASNTDTISVYSKAPNPEWQVVNTGNKATTAPYALAWYDDNSEHTQGWLGFSVLGGTQNTFRYVLEKPTITTSNTRIWGKGWTYTDNPITARLTKRTGSAGSYVYTTVGSVTFTSGTSFTSGPLTVEEGKTYCLEFDIPAGDGLDPALKLHELHVSNGKVNTTLPRGSISKTWGRSTRAHHVGSLYASTIWGRRHRAHGFDEGTETDDAVDVPASNGDTTTTSTAVYSNDGTISIPKADFSTAYTARTISPYVVIALSAKNHLSDITSMPTSASPVMNITFYNSSGTVTRTVPWTMTSVTNQDKEYSITINVNAGETAASATISLTGQPAFVGFKVSRFDLMVNKPSDITYFTGSEIKTTAQWVKSVAWLGKAKFSQSILKAPLPSAWEVSGFAGFDSDASSVRFSGGSVRVRGSLPAGQAYIGFRRGTYTSNFTVAAKPQGAGSATTLGTITSGTDFAQAMVTIPAGGASYVDFIITGGSPYVSLKDVFAIMNWSPFVPIPSATWAGFNRGDFQGLSLQTHPSAQSTPISVKVNADKTRSLTTGPVLGWSEPLIGGGYLPVKSSYTVTTEAAQVEGGYVHAAVRIQPALDYAGGLTIRIQGATDAQALAGTWTSLGSTSVNGTSYQEQKIVDVAVGTYTHVRIAIEASGVGLSRPGSLAVVDGAVLTTTATPLGATFPGFFPGVTGMSGQAAIGEVRQCHVEVTEAIDMTSLAYGTLAEFNVALTVPASFWEDVSETITTVQGAAGTTEGTFLLTDLGGATAPMTDLFFEITPVSGTLTKFSLTDKATGATFTYDGVSQSKITIDSNLSAVVNNKGNSIVKYVTESGGSVLLPLHPYWRAQGESITGHVDGTPVLEWSSIVPLRVTVTGRRKFLVA